MTVVLEKIMFYHRRRSAIRKQGKPAMTEVKKEYLASRVQSATPMELVRMLYEGALDSVNKALTYLQSGQVQERGQCITKASEIINELRVSLRPIADNEYSSNLAELYGYMQHRLLRAHVEKSEAMLSEVSRLLQCLLDGWVGAMRSQQANLKAVDLLDNEPLRQAAPPPPSYFESTMAGAEAGRSWQF